MAGVNNKSLSERTAELIYDMIMVEKRLAPGDKLPNENELSNQLGVSRTTLREAVRILVAQGILTVMRGVGTYISRDLSPLPEYSTMTLEKMRVRLSDLYEIRLMFEPQALRLACLRATEGEVKDIAAHSKRVEELVRTNGNWPDADQEFHEMLAFASHNEFIINLFPIINSAVHDAMTIAENKEELKDIVIYDNRQILDFLERRDGEGAFSAMDMHIRHTINALGLYLTAE